MVHREAMLYDRVGEGRVHCRLCAHECRIPPSGFGFCAVRENRDGTLYTHTYGRAVAESADPIEKKPLFHVLPGSRAYSIAAIGCNFKCAFCQNWQISQTREALRSGVGTFDLPPETVVARAVETECRSIAYTYTEPTIFWEYAFDTARLAREKGLYNVFVTNGFMTKDALDAMRPYMDAANVDLKSFRDEMYRKVCAGRLAPVCDSIRRMHQYGVWVEVTTLVIPGENDSDAELKDIASFIAETGREIPWHISLFHPDYRFTDHDYTPLETLQRASRIGREAGLRYVYLGNVSEEENTHCHRCGELLIRRHGYRVMENRVAGGECPRCGADTAGIGLSGSASGGAPVRRERR